MFGRYGQSDPVVGSPPHTRTAVNGDRSRASSAACGAPQRTRVVCHRAARALEADLSECDSDCGRYAGLRSADIRQNEPGWNI